MHSRRARNTWILLRHEFARRIRTRSFLLTTFLMPLLMAGLVGVPIAAGKQVNRHSQNIVVVTPDSDLAPLLRES
ncbi:MAG TPA: hypothetical protein VEJ86_14130, partial [Candidatus Binataceae bacterium]|nr:hypothetical protein [Candidatus Binataceae bacterium]